jgi:inhibitor of cysteine peptidase
MGTTHRLTGADDGGVVKVRRGDAVELELPENPTTGYRWDLETHDVLAAADEFVQPPGEAGIGAGGAHRWRFVLDRAGEARIALRHWQPWEGEPSVDQRFAVRIEVGD